MGKKKKNASKEHDYLNDDLLKVEKNRDLLPIARAIERLYEQFKECDEGEIADYIPELAKANKNNFCISLTTIDGNTHTVGNKNVRFSIQSISKPFIYGLALETHSREEVLKRIGVEPTGDSYDAMLKLDSSNKPYNPMVNAGAIVASDMVAGKTHSDRLDTINAMFTKYIGREPNMDMSVYTSERNSGNRNKALSYLLLNFDNIKNKVDDTLDLYFQQCAVRISSADLSVMASTLANHGVNPLTNEQAIHPQYIRDILSVMLTCGMYDYSGQWAFNIGMPAKSAVSGGIMMVIPGVGGLGIYSAPLDKYGNSVRGVKVCEELSRQIGLHILDASFASLRDRAFGEKS